MQNLLETLSALADPTRLKIMLLVRDMELAMGELADVLDQSQPRVSRHVRILAEAGLLRRHKEGAWVFVALGPDLAHDEIYGLIDRLLDGEDPCVGERKRLVQVRADRQRAVDHWFQTNAEEWDLMRRLEGTDCGAEDALVELASTPVVGKLLDIGTGTGRVLELLGRQADAAIGIDRSPEMLRLARSKLAANALACCEVRQADMRALPFQPASFDTITLYHVLHFADDPAAVIVQAAPLLTEGGKMIVVDYAPHTEESLRARFQHLRLGFEAETVHAWLTESGLAARTVSHHPGPDLTVTIWEGRR